jgi:hypothetical protein
MSSGFNNLDKLSYDTKLYHPCILQPINTNSIKVMSKQNISLKSKRFFKRITFGVVIDVID